MCVKDKCCKCKRKLKITVQNEKVSKTDHSFVPNIDGKEVKVQGAYKLSDLKLKFHNSRMRRYRGTFTVPTRRGPTTLA